MWTRKKFSGTFAAAVNGPDHEYKEKGGPTVSLRWKKQKAHALRKPLS
jgi:hypothetical protein